MSKEATIYKGVYTDLPSETYHTIGNTFSSSQLKDLLEDPEYFYKKYIKKEIEREKLDAFDIGTYFHTAVLEPHKLKEEIAVFEGIRRGKEWEEFQEKNKGKVLVNKTQRDTAEALVTAVKTLQ